MKITLIDAKGNRRECEIDFNKNKRERQEKEKLRNLNISEIKLPEE